MRLKTLYLENFGPFKEYEIEFPTESKSCILITGKNNAGKTTIIRGINLISSALHFARGSSKPIEKQLFKKDVQIINVQTMIYRFQSSKATIQATFDNEKTIKVILDGTNNTVTCEIPAFAHTSMSQLFGFLPPLGQLAEQETMLTDTHLRRYIDSSLAPHHLRNHLYHYFTEEQYLHIREIMRDTWEGIELQHCDYDIASGLFTLMYKEGDFINEIAWAGQGLQIWLQIVTHLVRLSHHPILLLDEPEIFLHPKKQHDLIQLLLDHYSGYPIISTHSSELMNNIDISHIIYIQKDTSKSTIRKTSDRNSLEKIRRNIGSTFNFHASQFEDVDSLLVTEHLLDYDIIQKLALHCNITTKTQNVKLSGFSRWKDYAQYREAYNIYFGRQIECSMLLDRDFYPSDYLDSIIDTLRTSKVKIAFTPGKEIENLFLEEDFIASLLPEGENPASLHDFLDQIYNREYEICKSKYVEFTKGFSEINKHKTYSTILAEMGPKFDSIWLDKSKRHNLIPGKATLAEIRDFFRSHYLINLTTSLLASELSSSRKTFVKEFLAQII